MPWGWIFAQIIGDRRFTKVAKIMALRWRLIFLRQGQVCFPIHLYGPHTLVWEKCWEFQTTSPLKQPGQCCSNFIWSLLEFGEQKIGKTVAVHWPRWQPCPYMVKTFKKLLLQNRRCLGAESLEKSSRMWGLPKSLKWWLYINVWPFYGKVASLCICISPIHLYGKNVKNFKELLWSRLANVAQISYWASLGRGNERLLKWLWSIDKGGRHAYLYMVKTFKNFLLQN